MRRSSSPTSVPVWCAWNGPQATLRWQAPVWEGPSGERGSLPFLHFNTKKRSLALDIERWQGRPVLDRLLASSDVLIDNYDPARAARLDRDRIRSLAHGLIHMRITGFGESGPHTGYLWSDLVAQAMAGVMVLTGFPDDPPVRLPGAQSYHQASLEAAVGTAALVVRRDQDGRGRQLEVSMQDALAMTTLQTANLNHSTQVGVVPLRTGSGNPARDFSQPGRHGRSLRQTLYPCRDGAVVVGMRLIESRAGDRRAHGADLA